MSPFYPSTVLTRCVCDSIESELMNLSNSCIIMKCTALKAYATPGEVIFPKDQAFEITLAGW